MCGIFGIAEFDGAGGKGEMSAVLDAMGWALVHRGPDDEGTYLFRGPGMSVGIGMRRLSIIDVEGGRQPMTNEDGSVIVVCNGEIYNYQELREELASKGHRLRTQSDTEVIVHLYEEHGWGCVTRLRGMFAFALWDAKKSVLLLARDRLGIKPLFYHCDHGRAAFASELRGLLPAFDDLPEVRQSSLLRLLLLQYVPAPETAFAGIQKLMPGTVLLVSARGLKSRRYWQPPTIGQGEEERTATDIQRAVADRLREAVQSHLVSDVPIGAFLSGGVDSTSVVALMRRAGAGPFNTFSVGFEGPPEFTELPYARQVAARYGTRHHELLVGPKDVMACLPKIVSHLDEPLTDPAIVPTALLSGFAAQSVKVVLTGEGADELFGGYQRYALDKLAAWYRLMPAGLKMRVLDWLRRSSINRRVVQGVRALSQSSPTRRHVNWVGTFTPEELRQIVADPEEATAEEREIEQMFQAYFDEGEKPASALAGMLRADLSTWLPDDLLAKVDRMSMAASLEARVPYLDHPLVELVAGISPTLKIRHGVRKAILKDAVAGMVPESILTRRKMGFEMPLSSWMRGPLREFVTDLLAMEGPPGLFNQAAVERFWDQHLREIQDRSKQVWSVVLVKLWYQVVVRERAGVAC
ncbi:MAG: asparagine synthase (glutamine-hydrolyzing) [Nitrospirae bacterium]|nr:asparagine synthase (glutamine-hydrolyzing) [Nitrospirota bacterium]